MKTIGIVLTFLFFSVQAFGDRNDPLVQYRRYYNDTLRGIEKMRGPSGLVADSTFIGPGCTPRISNPATSPTNIALDLVNQLGFYSLQKKKSTKATLEKILDGLTALERHHSSGLFYNWYSSVDSSPIKKSLSSVDNIHLALALWTAAKLYPQSSFGKKAKALFDEMNFSVFVENDGTVSGNYKYKNGAWEKDSYGYVYIGSEARILYALIEPLGLNKDKNFKVALTHTKGETYFWDNDGKEKPIMKTWGGQTFQLFLPQFFLGEDEVIAPSLDNYSAFVIERAKEEGLDLPWTLTPSNQGTGENAEYNGDPGTRELLGFGNTVNVLSPRFDSVVASHGIFLAATRAPKKYGPWLRRAQALGRNGTSFYCDRLGFLDGYHVKGPKKGFVVPYQLSLDQGMSLLALTKILTGSTPTEKALFTDLEVKKSLREYSLEVKRVIEHGVHHF